MTQALVQRMIWKEYRTFRGFWISIAVLTLLAAVVRRLPEPRGHGRSAGGHRPALYRAGDDRVLCPGRGGNALQHGTRAGDVPAAACVALDRYGGVAGQAVVRSGQCGGFGDSVVAGHGMHLGCSSLVDVLGGGSDRSHDSVGRHPLFAADPASVAGDVRGGHRDVWRMALDPLVARSAGCAGRSPQFPVELVLYAMHRHAGLAGQLSAGKMVVRRQASFLDQSR